MTDVGAARTTGRGLATIGVAIGIASVAGYALLVLVGHALGPAQFGLFVAFWGVLFGLGGSLSTVEQEVARRTASRDVGDDPSVGNVVTAAATIAGLLALLTAIPAISTKLYGSGGQGTAVVVVVAVVGFAVQFAVRGSLVGAGVTRGYSAIVVAEAVFRLAAVALIWAAVGLSLANAAVAVGVGSFAWLMWPGRARQLFRTVRTTWKAWVGSLRRATSLMIGAALTAAVITGYPTLVTSLVGSAPGAAGGAVFAALTISRVPLLLVSPVQAVAVPTVVRMRADERTSGEARLRRIVTLGTAAAVVLGALAGAVAWAVGPWAVRLLYGPSYDVAGWAVALLVFSAFLLAFVLLVSAALIALGSYRRMILMWLAAVVATVLWLVVSPLEIVPTTAVGAAVAPLVAMFVGLPMLLTLTATTAPAPSTV